jgi:hypothetical protein
LPAAGDVGQHDAVPSECAVTEDAETEQTEQVTFTIANLRAVAARDLFALLDVEVRVAGLSFWIMGVQGRRARNGGALIQLPTYRDTDGRARPAVVMPEELRKPLVDAVMEFLAEEGAVERRYRA